MSVCLALTPPQQQPAPSPRSVQFLFAVSNCYANAAMVRKRKADGQGSFDSGSTDWINELFHQHFAASDGFQVLHDAVSTALFCKPIVFLGPATRRASVLTLTCTV